MTFSIEKELIDLFYARGFVSRQHWQKSIWRYIGDYIITDWVKNPVGDFDRLVALNDRGKILAAELITIKHHIQATSQPGISISVKESKMMNFSKYKKEQFIYGLKYIFGRDILIKEDYPSEGCITGIIDNAENRFIRFSNYINWHVDKDPEVIKNIVAKEIWIGISKHSELLWDNHCIEVSGWGFNSEEGAEVNQYEETS